MRLVGLVLLSLLMHAPALRAQDTEQFRSAIAAVRFGDPADLPRAVGVLHALTNREAAAVDPELKEAATKWLRWIAQQVQLRLAYVAAAQGDLQRAYALMEAAIPGTVRRAGEADPRLFTREAARRLLDDIAGSKLVNPNARGLVFRNRETGQEFTLDYRSASLLASENVILALLTGEDTQEQERK